MKCLVVDDDPLTCDTVESFLQRIEGVDYCLKVNDGATALHLLAAERFDAVFLDLQLPGMDGVSLLKALPSNTPVVVISASAEFGAESYGFDVVDYLVKPLEFSRFAKAMVKLKGKQPVALDQAAARPDAFFLRDGNAIQRVDLTQLLYVEAQSNYASFVFEKSKPVMSLVSLRKLEAELPEGFIRIHRSYIVNERRIRQIEGNQLHIGDSKLPIGQSYREALYQRLHVVN